MQKSCCLQEQAVEAFLFRTCAGCKSKQGQGHAVEAFVCVVAGSLTYTWVMSRHSLQRHAVESAGSAACPNSLRAAGRARSLAEEPEVMTASSNQAACSVFLAIAQHHTLLGLRPNRRRSPSRGQPPVVQKRSLAYCTIQKTPHRSHCFPLPLNKTNHFKTC